jgi:hypothetical protein
MPHNPQCLFVIEHVFEIGTRGVIVEPGPLFGTFNTNTTMHTCAVVLKRPDGHATTVEAVFVIPFLSPLQAQIAFLKRGRYSCLLNGLFKSDVPIGTEVWTT